jgi:hypothetical protein
MAGAADGDDDGAVVETVEEPVVVGVAEVPPTALSRSCWFLYWR